MNGPKMRSQFTLDMHDYIYRPDGKLFYNREMFGAIARQYDFVTKVLSFGRDRVWKERLIAELPDVQRPACLDIGCGTGDIAFLLARRYPLGQITGLDLTEQMAAIARSRNSFGNVVFTIQDMCKMDLPDCSFDIVTAGYAIRNAPDAATAMREILRVMKPGATGAFLDFMKSADRLSRGIQDVLLRAWGGFWGLLLNGNPRLYTYIAESIQQLPDREQLKRLMMQVGFANIRSHRHFFGVTETILFQRP